MEGRDANPVTRQMINTIIMDHDSLRLVSSFTTTGERAQIALVRSSAELETMTQMAIRKTRQEVERLIKEKRV